MSHEEAVFDRTYSVIKKVSTDWFHLYRHCSFLSKIL